MMPACYAPGAAMRMPISPVRRATACAIAPYSPTHAINSARAAKQLPGSAKVRSCEMVALSVYACGFTLAVVRWLRG